MAQGTVTSRGGHAGALPAGIVHSQESQTAEELGEGCAEPLTFGLFGMAALGFLSHPASSVPAWCLGGLAEVRSHVTWRAEICAGWKFCSANEYVGELHIERNSIYFVQGKIPLHSEQIYYKSVLP